MKKKTSAITIIAVMSALSTVIYMIFPEIPIVPGIDYLKIDFSDLPAIVTGITMGPVCGIAIEVIKNIFHLLKTTTFGIGEIMNIGVGCAMILGMHGFIKLFSKLFKKERFNGAVYYISCALTIAVVILAGWGLNAVFTPVFYKIINIPITSESILAGVIGSTSLNAIKSAFNLLPFYPVIIAFDKAMKKLSH